VNPLDVVLGGVILLSTVLGAWRGLLREMIGIVGVGGALIAAYLLTPLVLPLFGADWGMLAYVVVSVGIFLTAMVAVSLLGWVLARVVRALHLGGIDRLMGGFFGLLRAGVLTVLALTLVILLVRPAHPLLAESRILALEAPAVYWMGSRLPVDRAREEFLTRWGDLAQARGWGRGYGGVVTWALWGGSSGGGTGSSWGPRAVYVRR
jgi:membrane protein required for colicin V production